LTMEHTEKGEKSFYKTGIMIVTLIFAGALTYYYHAMLGTATLFTHLFYIPIILSAMWWRRGGVYIAVFLGLMLLLSHAIFLKTVPFTDDVVRSFMFVVIGVVLDRLMDGIRRIEGIYKQLTT
jgi:hypothetical protein